MAGSGWLLGRLVGVGCCNLRQAYDLLGGFDRRQRVRSGAELGKAPRLRRHVAFERADGGVVRAERIVERAADLLQMPDERREALVQLLAELADLRGVLRRRRLAPAIG